MGVCTVRLYPDAILKRPAEEVDVKDPKVVSFLTDMVETLRAFPGCVGLAAPQIGKPWRVISVDASRYRKNPGKHHGLFVLMNPKIIHQEGSAVIREGCLSVPHYTGNVPRSLRVTVEGQNREGRMARIEAKDFEAIILQHEMDHLNGLLFLDRVVSRRSDLFRRKSYLKP